jgi:hypothetical protein
MYSFEESTMINFMGQYGQWGCYGQEGSPRRSHSMLPKSMPICK